MRQTFAILFMVNQTRGTAGYCKCGEELRYKNGWVHYKNNTSCSEVKVQSIPNNPIVVRVTVNGVDASFVTKESINPEKWDMKAKRVKGSKGETAQINERIRSIDQDLRKIYKDMKNPTAEQVKARFLNVIVKTDKITTLFDCYADLYKKQEEMGVRNNTLITLNTSLTSFKSYVKEKYGTDDILLEDIDMEFCMEYVKFANKKLKRKSTELYYIKFSTVYSHAVMYGYIPYSKIAGFKLGRNLKIEENAEDKKMEKELTEEELDRVVRYWETLPVHSPKRVYLNMFMFAVEQGQCFIDLINTKEDDVTLSIETGRHWLTGRRKKTGTRYISLMSRRSLDIIEEMKSHPMKREDFVFPKIAYMTHLSGLRAVAKKLGLDNLTSHMARHICGVLKIKEGWSMEAVSRMLGHRNIVITQNIYVDIRVERLDKEYNEIEAKRMLVEESNTRRLNA